MNYQIIKNEVYLQNFIDLLPELKTNEVYYISLFARRKYSKLVPSNNDSHLRSITVKKKEQLFSRIRQMECPIGSYTIKGKPIPQEGLALYMFINPRNTKKAAYHLMHRLTTLLGNSSEDFNVYREALRSVQRSKSKTRYVVFDIDAEKESIDFNKLSLIIPNYFVIQTKNGYHILVPTNLASKKIAWFKQLQAEFTVDALGDIMSPVPGCTQGNFIPTIHTHFLKTL